MAMTTLTLRTARCAFALAVANLVLYAASNGYSAALAEGMDRKTIKDPTTDHMSGSLHEIGLAQDIDLYDTNGVYLTKTEDHAFLGDWWEEYGVEHGLPLAWGGHFKQADGNHYSMRWLGRA